MEGNEKEKAYLKKFFTLLQMRENLKIIQKNAPFNQTELRLLGEVISGQSEGKRYISTQLADTLGVTRSAISQIANNLERRGVIQRVPDEVDRKIAYIQIADGYMDIFRKELGEATTFVGKIVERLGENRFMELCDAFESMVRIADEELKKIGKEYVDIKGY